MLNVYVKGKHYPQRMKFIRKQYNLIGVLSCELLVKYVVALSCAITKITATYPVISHIRIWKGSVYADCRLYPYFEGTEIVSNRSTAQDK